ncbi:exonuclease [Desmospora sp. 8437]|nr:exonuclease [Desmospora sp. 8437]
MGTGRGRWPTPPMVDQIALIFKQPAESFSGLLLWMDQFRRK